MAKRNFTYYAKIIGIILLLPGPLFCIFEYSAIFLFWLATALAVLHMTSMPQGIPSLPLSFCENPLFYYLGFVDLIGCLFLFYGLTGKKKSKKNYMIWVFVLLISIFV